MGLFDDPYKFCNTEREQTTLNNPKHREIARDIASKSIVLLKNEKSILPISKNTKTIAFIGPLVKEHKQNMGFWAVELPGTNYNEQVVSQWEGVQNKVSSDTKFLYAKGCEIEGDNKEGFAEAIALANQSDIVILSVGEFWNSSGEAKSKSNIHLPGVQEDLIKAIQTTGKPVVVLVNAGRPLIFNWTSENVPAILYTWWLGSEAGNAIADVLFGDYNPSGKLPMTFPRDEGQIPIYYNHLNTGRPAHNEPVTNYASGYTDIKNSPVYAFGHGLSYTTFNYSDLNISNHKMKMNQEIIVTLKVTNSGKFAGEEIVQLYLRDKVASVVRPIMELKDFQKIKLNIGETKTVTFIIDNQKLSFYNEKLDYISEPGDFDLLIGSSSKDIHFKETFELIK